MTTTGSVIRPVQVGPIMAGTLIAPSPAWAGGTGFVALRVGDGLGGWLVVRVSDGVGGWSNVRVQS